MALLPDCSAEIFELQRLNHLLQPDWRSQITIARSTAINPPLIMTEHTKKSRKSSLNQAINQVLDQTAKHRFAMRFVILIDGIRWQKLPVPQQDLLFWHEVARIQAKTVPTGGWELPVMSVGLSLALIEISAQNVISLAAVLVAVALSGHQLYQRHRGERSLREAAAADREAIQLAVQAGYAFSEALTSLYNALKGMAKSASKADWQRLQVRLRALEILATERERRSPTTIENMEVSWQN